MTVRVLVAATACAIALVSGCDDDEPARPKVAANDDPWANTAMSPEDQALSDRAMADPDHDDSKYRVPAAPDPSDPKHLPRVLPVPDPKLPDPSGLPGLTPDPYLPKGGGMRVAAPYRVRWGDISATSGCSFFSGPDGRDDKLAGQALVERNGQSVRITIGDAEFTGAFHRTGIDLVRVSPHEQGTKWLVFESLRGSGLALLGAQSGRSTTLRYRYHECQSQSGQPCPGRCTITGEVTLEP